MESYQLKRGIDVARHGIEKWTGLDHSEPCTTEAQFSKVEDIFWKNLFNYGQIWVLERPFYLQDAEEVRSGKFQVDIGVTIRNLLS
jgi:hypothetical protein